MNLFCIFILSISINIQEKFYFVLDKIDYRLAGIYDTSIFNKDKEQAMSWTLLDKKSNDLLINIINNNKKKRISYFETALKKPYSDQFYFSNLSKDIVISICTYIPIRYIKDENNKDFYYVLLTIRIKEKLYNIALNDEDKLELLKIIPPFISETLEKKYHREY